MDIAQKETESLLAKLEKELSKQYSRAVEEVEEKTARYFEQFRALDQKKRELLEKGLITKEEYKKWRLGKILIGERWKEMRDSLAQDLVNADIIAESTIKGYMPEVYALNHNYSTFRVEGISGVDTGYTLYSRETVERLWRENPDLMPEPRVDIPKDMKWNRKHIQSELTQGIIQGEGIKDLAKRMKRVVGMDETSAVRNARTMITSAQNGGRQDAYKRATTYGIIVLNQWQATMDGRVRHTHAILDRETREIGEKFSNGCRYPGDPNGAPSELYNCRCALIPVLPDYPYESDWRDNNAEYDAWKKDHAEALKRRGRG